MSGVVIVDARYAGEQADRIVRAAAATGGALDRQTRQGRLATLVPIDKLRVADLALVRISDREWVVVKDRHGYDGRTLGPEEVSEILAVQRRFELGLTPWESRPFFDAERVRSASERGQEIHEAIEALGHGEAAREHVEQEITAGRLQLDGSDITVHLRKGLTPAEARRLASGGKP